jgi:chemotaxis signal transduction protein
MIQLASPHLPDAGKYLTFVLHNEHYSVPVLKVREIMRLCPITTVPRMPARAIRLAQSAKDRQSLRCRCAI